MPSAARVSRFWARFAYPRMPLVVAGLTALLLVPSLFGGLAADDYAQWLRARGQVPFGSRWNVFDFCDGTDWTVSYLKDDGILAWWASEGMRLRFFRPLTSVTHVLDYTQWPSAPWIMHAENLAIAVALAYLAAALLRRVLGPGLAAGLAALLYALNMEHGSVGWIAGRNTALAPALGVGALILHDRWRRDGWRPGAWLAPALFVAALLAGEAGLATIAYVAAYALCLDDARPRGRLASVAPYVGIALVWQLAYRMLGYGALGSELYLDPGRNPGRFGLEAPGRAATMLVGAIALPPADVALLLSPAGKIAVAVWGAIFVALFAWLVAPLFARDRACRFLTLGALFAVVPVCAMSPSNRLLAFVDLGAMGVLAQMARAAIEGPSEAASKGRQWVGKWLVVPWVLLRLAVSPPLVVASSLSFHLLERTIAARSEGLLTPPDLVGRWIVVVNAPDPIFAIYRFFVPIDGILAHAGRGRLLSVTTTPVHVSRSGERAITLRADDDLLAAPLAGVMRADSDRMRVGQRFEVVGMHVRADDVAANGHASAATFELDMALDDPRLYWIAWDHGRFVAWTPPPVGGEVIVGQ